MKCLLINLVVNNHHNIEMKNIIVEIKEFNAETDSVKMNNNHKLDLLGNTKNNQESNFNNK